MGIFNAVLGGQAGAQYMSQELFNTVVFLPYVSRSNHETFDQYWHASTPNESGDQEKLTQIFTNYAAKFSKDEYLHTQFSQASMELEKYWMNKFGVHPLSFQLFNVIKHLADQLLPNGEQATEAHFMHGKSHPNPQLRVAQCLADLKAYEQMVASRGLPDIDPEEKTHFFTSDLYEGMVSKFKYSGSDLKVYEEDCFMQDEQVTWARWGLFRNATSLTDIWLVKIENDLAQVVKIAVQKTIGEYELDEVPKMVEPDDEIRKAISKSKACALENSTLYGAAPPYLQMINLVKALGY